MKSTFQNRNCGVCDSAEKRVLFRQPLILPEGRCSYSGYSIVVCGTCGFVFADTLMSQDASDEHYAGPTKVAQALAQSGEAERDLLRIDNTLRAVLPLAEPQDSIFDVGCGTGRLLGLLKQKGFANVSGIDQSDAAAEIARTKYNVPVTVGSIFDYVARDIDIVTTCHVLEHIVDLHAFVLRLFALIGAKGVLYVEVPNACDFSRFADPEAPGIWVYIRDLFTHFTPEHVNFFSPTSLRNLMTRFGFEEIFCDSKHFGVISSAWKRHSITIDRTTEAEIELYAQKSQLLQAGALGVIRELTASRTPILVWGAGLHTQRLLASSELGNAHIVAFIDSDPSYQGGELAGRRIISPSEIGSVKGEPPILISSWKSQSVLLEAIKGLPIRNEAIVLYADRL